MTSPFISFARRAASAVFPLAVGPKRKMTGLFSLVGRVLDLIVQDLVQNVGDNLLAGLLYFILVDLAKIDHMYQFSLASFVTVFTVAMDEAEASTNPVFRENALVDSLCLKSTDFIQYKKELEERYSCLKTYLLTDKQKTILNRILSPATDKISWYQSLSYIILDKQLDNLIDEEEAYLIDNLIHLFKELDKYIDISRKNLTNEDNFIRIEMISNNGAISPQVVRLNKDKIDIAQKVERQIDNLLSGDSEVDAYALLMILKKKLGDE